MSKATKKRRNLYGPQVTTALTGVANRYFGMRTFHDKWRMISITSRPCVNRVKVAPEKVCTKVKVWNYEAL